MNKEIKFAYIGKSEYRGYIMNGSLSQIHVATIHNIEGNYFAQIRLTATSSLQALSTTNLDAAKHWCIHAVSKLGRTNTLIRGIVDTAL